MKARSPFFARIQGDVLAIVASVPPGRLVTFAEVGAHLDVMPRHVAYILAMLDGPERDLIPWHRAVAADGRVEKPAQRTALAAEGFAFDPDGRVSGFLAHVAPAASLPHGVAAQKRPADAPVARTRRRRP
ncbi:MAG: MGMT family protein [Rubritepida sp.]|nr:MGMT family protein [Rubritepida sp.]